MKKKITLLLINKLKTHEAVCQRRVLELMGQIKKEGYLKNPVVVDKETLVLLDGHHRLAALKKIGVKRIPAFLIDYKNSKVKVYLRRKELLTDLIKEAVIRKALINQVFPQKTTRHLLGYRPRNINIKLKNLV
ncbi:MAG TPA: ParB N-terminal domain-containing protein [Candidatus Bathyarchaeia archaeon]|nr:ParB N-terminal domain-containing protein [Candidatus Bathyarchaeia archaeon]